MEMSRKLRHAETVQEYQELKKIGGQWLKELREKAGYTQRSFALAVGVDYYTFISQIETGRGRVPEERIKDWAITLGMQPKEFLQEYMKYWDPVTYDILFSDS